MLQERKTRRLTKEKFDNIRLFYTDHRNNDSDLVLLIEEVEYLWSTYKEPKLETPVAYSTMEEEPAPIAPVTENEEASKVIDDANPQPQPVEEFSNRRKK